jgi:hypothetical protein
VQVQVLHELNVVHEHLLADVALERHVRLEFRLQELRLPLNGKQARCFQARNYGHIGKKDRQIFLKREKNTATTQKGFFLLITHFCY